jgi:hypothetical protein
MLLGHDISGGGSAPEGESNLKEIGIGEGKKGPTELGGVFDRKDVPENRVNELIGRVDVDEKVGGGVGGGDWL